MLAEVCQWVDAMAQAHGVPCLPGYAGEDQSDERFAAEAARMLGAKSFVAMHWGTYKLTDNVQVAPQEVEVSSYLVGQIDSEVHADDLGDFEL